MIFKTLNICIRSILGRPTGRFGGVAASSCVMPSIVVMTAHVVKLSLVEINRTQAGKGAEALNYLTTRDVMTYLDGVKY